MKHGLQIRAIGMIGIDQFIADNKVLSKGYGTLMINQFIRYLIKQILFAEIRMDPRPDNIRAIN